MINSQNQIELEAGEQQAARRQTLYLAALKCGHSITDESIVLQRNAALKGNALSQLADRLAAASAAIAIPMARSEPMTEQERLDLQCMIDDYMDVTEKHLRTDPKVEAAAASIVKMVDQLFSKRAGLIAPLAGTVADDVIECLVREYGNVPVVDGGKRGLRLRKDVMTDIRGVIESIVLATKPNANTASDLGSTTKSDAPRNAPSDGVFSVADDDMPPPNVEVLVYAKVGTNAPKWYLDERYAEDREEGWGNFSDSEVSHWAYPPARPVMSLPKMRDTEVSHDG